MWETDLTSLESALAELDATRDANEKALQQARRVAQGRGQNKRPPKPAAGKGGKGKKGKKAASDSEDEWDDDDSDFEVSGGGLGWETRGCWSGSGADRSRGGRGGSFRKRYGIFM